MYSHQTSNANDEKQLSVMFTFEPAARPGAGIGASILYDVIPSRRGTPGRDNEIDEIIGGMHAYYVRQPFEAIVETQYIHHRDGRANRSYDHHGGYAQFAYRLGKAKPYYRFDWLGMDTADPYYVMLDIAQDTVQHTVGIRYDWKSFAAIKAEYRRRNAEVEDSDAVTVQFSFGF